MGAEGYLPPRRHHHDHPRGNEKTHKEKPQKNFGGHLKPVTLKPIICIFRIFSAFSFPHFLIVRVFRVFVLRNLLRPLVSWWGGPRRPPERERKKHKLGVGKWGRTKYKRIPESEGDRKGRVPKCSLAPPQNSVKQGI